MHGRFASTLPVALVMRFLMRMFLSLPRSYPLRRVQRGVYEFVNNAANFVHDDRHVGDYSSAIVNVWRGVLTGTGPTFAVKFEQSNGPKHVVHMHGRYGW